MIRRFLAALAAWLPMTLLTHLPAPAFAGPAEEVPYEFRGLWVASVSNLDWPSRPGLSSEQQMTELKGIIDQAAAMNFNAIVFQVRCECDALYNSPYEPWSRFLTGTQGVAPNPPYDPLALAVDLAHKRGLELHAWFNPYRAARSSNAAVAASHVSKTKPEIVRNIGSHLWLDPSESGSAEHIRRVIHDIVSRYDIDGIHYDDYFYPYRSYYAKGVTEFPDDRQWTAYRAQGGSLSRDDWRRDHVNRLVRQIYADVKETKPWVKVGISPFGIWRPGHPPSVQGMDQFRELFADARLWLNEGWLDYFSPQLYWKTNAPQQPYGDLLSWWISQNNKKRHMWPGLIPGNVQEKGWPATEIVQQVTLTRESRQATGNVHFRARNVLNHAPLREAFRTLYSDGALVPPTPWLANARPAKPTIAIEKTTSPGTTIAWSAAPGQTAARWALFARYGDRWSVRTIPATQTRLALAPETNPKPVSVAVSAIDRAGNLSEVATVEIGQ